MSDDDKTMAPVVDLASRRTNLTDVGNAQRLIARHGHDLHYIHPWNRWMVWDGRRWIEDQTADAESRLKETLRALTADLSEIEDTKQRKAMLRHLLESERASRMQGALSLARSEPGIPLLPADLDPDPLLLNLRNCTYDLATEAPRSHKRDDLITKLAPVDHDEDATCPRWQLFLQRILPDPELRAFVARLVGYSLTGETGEQILPILYGSGANGKSTFNETIKNLLGDYAQVAPSSTFLDSRDSIPNDVARLRGTRFVIASETSEGKRLNEALVKRLTGGDTIVARFLRAEYFEFKPTFKAWLATNHKPEVRGTDEAIWRRLRLIPFTVTIPHAEQDKELKEKLAAELPGILNWALDGYQDWRANGVQPPAAVLAATADYRAESDTIGAFILDCCHDEPEGWIRNGEIYEAYAAWAKSNAGDPMSPKAFTQRMQEKGYKQHRTKTGRTWLEIELN